MGNSTGRIIKAKDVKFEGCFYINIVPDNPNSANSAEQGVSATAAGATLEVNVIENQADHAVLEVTCSCGAKTHIKCQYGTNQ